jgi:TetR/AcrR family fatty acid metabolism transcriptional regulator
MSKSKQNSSQSDHPSLPGHREADGKAERILEAAVRVFSRKEYSNATVQDVAREASVGKGTVYLYYDSKSDLLEEVVAKSMIEFHSGLSRIKEQNLSGKQTLEAICRFTLEYACGNHELAHFLMENRSNVRDTFRERFRGLRDRIVDELRVVVQRELDAGTMAGPRAHLVALIGGAITTCLTSRLHRGTSGANRELGEGLDPAVLADILWHGMKNSDVE